MPENIFSAILKPELTDQELVNELSVFLDPFNNGISIENVSDIGKSVFRIGDKVRAVRTEGTKLFVFPIAEDEKMPFVVSADLSDDDVMTCVNLNRPAIHLRHAQLKPVGKEPGRYASDCPSCGDGILPVQRGPKLEILKNDCCVLCAQHFVYLDQEVVPHNLS